jgi:hypothetical protein
MKNNHPSEEELQEHALGTLAGARAFAVHVNSCETCKNQIAAYQYVDAGIKESTVNGFDFDLAAEVLAQIPVNQPVASKGKWDYLLAAAFLVLLTVPFYLYRHELAALFSEVSVTVACATSGLALIFLVIRISDMDRSYRCRLLMIK